MPQNRRSMENMLSLVNWWQIPLGYFLLFASYLGLRFMFCRWLPGLGWNKLDKCLCPAGSADMKASLPHWERDSSLSDSHSNDPRWLRNIETWNMKHVIRCWAGQVPVNLLCDVSPSDNIDIIKMEDINICGHCGSHWLGHAKLTITL